MEMSSIQHTVLLILHLVQTQEAPSAYCLQDVCKTTNAKEEDLSGRKDKEKKLNKKDSLKTLVLLFNSSQQITNNTQHKPQPKCKNKLFCG